MEIFSLLWQIFALVVLTTFDTVANVADEVMFTLEDNEIHDKIVKVRNIKQGPYQVPSSDRIG